ncbi:21957_t:CDS:2 [Cetraspora pellucida]|uniref:21957_t:CDS:1 n=1 Tax=Cetraspora pellucida TaxID=1433469 RepID=A0A9N9FXQ5_9GLOM|nr:21957_t:CDS:2 [Cetraspora pellucida]
MKSLIKNQPDLNDILIALNQLQLDNQTLYQENADLKNTLNQLRALGETDGQYREPKNLRQHLVMPIRPEQLPIRYENSFRDQDWPQVMLQNLGKFLVVRCDNQLFEHRQERPRDPSSGRYFNQVPNSSSIPTTEPMQIDTIKYRPLSAKEKEQCHANNLCLYCEEPGHMARNCFNKSNT